MHIDFVMCNKNKPVTAKVGAIPKAQNCKRGDPLGFVKLQLVAKHEKKIQGRFFKKIGKNQNEIFEQCHSFKSSPIEKTGIFDSVLILIVFYCVGLSTIISRNY